MLDLPSKDLLKQKGIFAGYWLGDYAQYYECFKLGKDIYALIDGVKNKKYFVYVERYLGKPQSLIRGLDAIDGSILPRINYNNVK